MRLFRIAWLSVLPVLGGCEGMIYTHTWEPYTTNFCRTPVFHSKLETGESDLRELQIPVPFRPRFLWHSNAIGDAARREGIEEVCYADIEHLAIFNIPFLFAIWRQDTIHVYGRPKAEMTTTPPEPTPTPTPN